MAQGTDFEIHVYHRGNEVGIFGSNGWFDKHGKTADVSVPDNVYNRLKGKAVGEMRAAGRIKPLGQRDISGDKWKMPRLGVLMRLVKVERTRDGFILDPTKYVASLDETAGSLPAGAAAYARDPQHYDFYGTRCVKDLKLDKMNLVDGYGALGLELRFAPNKFKHDSGLMIRYVDLIGLSVNVSSEPTVEKKWPETHRLGDVQLDEVWPHEAGCSHEIVMTGGTIVVVSSDLTAEWLDV